MTIIINGDDVCLRYNISPVRTAALTKGVVLSPYHSIMQDPLYGLLRNYYLRLREDTGSEKQVCSSKVLLNFKRILWVDTKRFCSGVAIEGICVIDHHS